MRYPKLRELKEAVKALIKGPYTSKFPSQPHQPFERFRGRPQFHEPDCVGCGACFQVCPSRAIEMQDTKDRRVFTVRWDMCIFCGQCQANCLTDKGIMLTGEFDLATTAKREELRQSIEKKLVLCECCSEIIAPYAQILWVAKRLGPLTFSNPSLILFHAGELSPVLKEGPSLNEDAEFLRSQRIKILCPRCRREAILKS